MGDRYDRNPELIRRAREGDRRALDELVTVNRPLVGSIAQRFSARGYDLEDIIECGNIGLIKAINTFDFSRNCAFSTYAVPLIFGEIRRFLRDDGMLKVSRDAKRLSAMIVRERDRRSASGEDVGIVSLAQACGVSPAEAAEALEATAPVYSIHEGPGDEDSLPLEGVLFDDEEEGRNFDRLSLHMAIEKLPSEQRKLILLRYYRDFSQSDTARALGMTQVKVSREEKKILAALKKELV